MISIELKGGIIMDSSSKLQVKCSVSNCQYYKDHLCHAENIEVNALGDGRAKTSDGTCCTTFINKSSTSIS